MFQKGFLCYLLLQYHVSYEGYLFQSLTSFNVCSFHILSQNSFFFFSITTECLLCYIDLSAFRIFNHRFSIVDIVICVIFMYTDIIASVIFWPNRYPSATCIYSGTEHAIVQVWDVKGDANVKSLFTSFMS